MAMFNCPHCNSIVDETTKVCPKCQNNIKKFIKDQMKANKKNGKAVGTISLGEAYHSQKSEALPQLDFLKEKETPEEELQLDFVEKEEPSYEEPQLDFAEKEEPSYEEPQLDFAAKEEPAYEETQLDFAEKEEPAYEETQLDFAEKEEPAYEEPQLDFAAKEEPAYEEPQLDFAAKEEPAYEEPQLDFAAKEEPAYEEPKFDYTEKEEPQPSIIETKTPSPMPGAPIPASPMPGAPVAIGESKKVTPQIVAPGGGKVVEPGQQSTQKVVTLKPSVAEPGIASPIGEDASSSSVGISSAPSLGGGSVGISSAPSLGGGSVGISSAPSLGGGSVGISSAPSLGGGSVGISASPSLGGGSVGISASPSLGGAGISSAPSIGEESTISSLPTMGGLGTSATTGSLTGDSLQQKKPAEEPVIAKPEPIAEPEPIVEEPVIAEPEPIVEPVIAEPEPVAEEPKVESIGRNPYAISAGPRRNRFEEEPVNEPAEETVEETPVATAAEPVSVPAEKIEEPVAQAPAEQPIFESPSLNRKEKESRKFSVAPENNPRYAQNPMLSGGHNNVVTKPQYDAKPMPKPGTMVTPANPNPLASSTQVTSPYNGGNPMLGNAIRKVPIPPNRYSQQTFNKAPEPPQERLLDENGKPIFESLNLRKISDDVRPASQAGSILEKERALKAEEQRKKEEAAKPKNPNSLFETESLQKIPQGARPASEAATVLHKNTMDNSDSVFGAPTTPQPQVMVGKPYAMNPLIRTNTVQPPSYKPAGMEERPTVLNGNQGGNE